MDVSIPQISLDTLQGLGGANLDARVIAQLLSSELTTKLNPAAADNNIAFVENFNFVNNSLNIDLFATLQDIYNTQDFDIEKLQAFEHILSLLDIENVENASPYELYAILILMSVIGL